MWNSTKTYVEKLGLFMMRSIRYQYLADKFAYYVFRRLDDIAEEQGITSYSLNGRIRAGVIRSQYGKMGYCLP